MATKWYLQNNLFADSADYPQTNQHTLTPTTGKIIDAFDVTRELLTSLGDGIQAPTITTNGTTSTQTLYWGRWMTPRLNLGGGISANTWTVVLGGWTEDPNNGVNFPVSGLNKTVPINCYVWRDGVGKVATIKQGSSNADWDELPNENTSFGGTFAGAAVSSSLIRDGDRIVYEIWMQIAQSNTTAWDTIIYYNGTAEMPLPYGSTVTSSASGSYISTPQTITEWTPPANISMNVDTKDLDAKFITAVI